MKAFGLQQLIKLYISWFKKEEEEDDEP